MGFKVGYGGLVFAKLEMVCLGTDLARVSNQNRCCEPYHRVNPNPYAWHGLFVNTSIS